MEEEVEELEEEEEEEEEKEEEEEAVVEDEEEEEEVEDDGADTIQIIIINIYKYVGLQHNISKMYTFVKNNSSIQQY